MSTLHNNAINNPMQDLIPEEEFLKTPHNPWKSFRIYYGIMAVFTLAYLVLVRMEMMTGPGFELIIVPPLFAALMFRFPEENASIPRNDKFLGILGLIGTFWATLLLAVNVIRFYTGTIATEDILEMLGGLFFAIPHLVLSFFFVAIVSYFYNKKHKPRMERRK